MIACTDHIISMHLTGQYIRTIHSSHKHWSLRGITLTIHSSHKHWSLRGITLTIHSSHKHWSLRGITLTIHSSNKHWSLCGITFVLFSICLSQGTIYAMKLWSWVEEILNVSIDKIWWNWDHNMWLYNIPLPIFEISLFWK